jgi:hypothetical protein
LGFNALHPYGTRMAGEILDFYPDRLSNQEFP